MASHGSSAYRRITGRLRLNGRSAILETADDNLFYLVTSDDLTAFHDCRVVVEGQLSGLGRLAITWIGVTGE
jgi:hypothetical protein